MISMINALVHVPPLYIANVILPLASVCSHVLGITPCIEYVKHAHPQHINLKVLKHFYRLGVAHFSMLQALEILIFSYSLFCVLNIIPP